MQFSSINPSKMPAVQKSEPKVKDHSKSESMKKNLTKLLDAVHRAGISITGILPFSSRGVILNVALAPIFIPIRMIQSIGTGFRQKMKSHLDRFWNQGIKDFYTDLEAPRNAAKKRAVYEGFSHYSDYMYAGILPRGNESRGVVVPNDLEGIKSEDLVRYNLTDKHVEIINQIQNKLLEMGFEKDAKGNFYDVKTGTSFNLICNGDQKNGKAPEIVICFMGLGNHNFFEITDEDKALIQKESLKAAGADWFGGIPPSARQAIEMGKVLKELTEGSGLNPVMVGHSHGGGLAQTGAVANGIKGVAFNSRPMGAGTRRYIGQSKIAKNAESITVFSGKGDWLSGTKVINVLSVIFERLTGIPVPRSVGTGYHLPKLEGAGKLENHVMFKDEMELLKPI
jgi:hypothetical protein